MARLEYHTCPIVYASVLQRCLYNQLKLVDAISFFRGKIRIKTTEGDIVVRLYDETPKHRDFFTFAFKYMFYTY